MIPTDWRPLRAGDTVYTAVTDHPNSPREFREGQPYLFRDYATAEKIALAWNLDGGDWTWYVKKFILLPKPGEPDRPELQMSLF
jgi:hypothetical protein